MHPVAQNAACLQPDQGAMLPEGAAQFQQVVHIAANAAHNEQRAAPHCRDRDE